MLRWNNDYNRIAHDAILKVMSECSGESYAGYGTDTLCDLAKERIRAHLGGADVDILMREVGKFTVEFTVGAQAFLKSAENVLVYTSPSGGFLNNPTPFVTKPLVRVVTNGIRVGGSVYIGAEVLTLNWGDTARREIWVDCEEEEAWEIVDGQEVSCNVWIAGANFIQIQPGRNDVSFTESFESVAVYTRCYTL